MNSSSPHLVDRPPSENKKNDFSVKLVKKLLQTLLIWSNFMEVVVPLLYLQEICPFLPFSNWHKTKQDCSYQGEALNVPTAL